MSVREPRARRGSGDEGETLVEVLATIVIMGITVVAILGAIANAILLSTTHRKQAAAGAYVRAFAEAIENNVAASTSAYAPCGAATTYQNLYPQPSGYVRTAAIKYWDGSQFQSTCTTDTGIQQLRLQVSSADGKVNESLTIIIREPCRTTDPSC